MYERFSPHVFNNLSLFSSFTVLSNFSSLESNLLIPLLLSLLITKKKIQGRKSDVKHGIIGQRIQRFYSVIACMVARDWRGKSQAY